MVDGSSVTVWQPVKDVLHLPNVSWDRLGYAVTDNGWIVDGVSE